MGHDSAGPPADHERCSGRRRHGLLRRDDRTWSMLFEPTPAAIRSSRCVEPRNLTYTVMAREHAVPTTTFSNTIQWR